MIWLADIIRTVCVPLAVIAAAISLRAAYDKSYRDNGQLARFFALSALTLAAAYAEYRALGHEPKWPTLILNVAGIVLSLVGTLPMVWKGKPLPRFTKKK